MVLTVLITFTACASSRIRNIDTFCDSFNLKNESLKISRNDFITEEKESVLHSYLLTDDKILIEILSDKNSMNIKRVNITAEKNDKKFLNIAVSAVKSLTDEIDNEETEKFINDLIANKEKEYANEMHTLEYVTLFYTKTASGHRFSISYNEEIPTETTTTPETEKEYSLESVTSQTFSQPFACCLFRQLYMCCQAEQ